jgi:D-aminopeptidase
LKFSLHEGLGMPRSSKSDALIVERRAPTREFDDGRRRFVVGGGAAGTGGAAALLDGEFGAPSQTLCGDESWTGDAADEPPADPFGPSR